MQLDFCDQVDACATRSELVGVMGRAYTDLVTSAVREWSRSDDTLGLRGFMNRTYVGVGISLGVCFGVALGAAMPNAGVGVAFGVALGVAFAMIFGGESDAALARKKAAADKPLPDPLGLFTRPN
jgi:hypothetical protein